MRLVNLVRDFTKGDWYGFQGAEAFPNGEPLICEAVFEGVEFYAVADYQGIQICLVGDENEPDMIWFWEISNTRAVQKCLFFGVLAKLEDAECAADISYIVDHMDGFEEV